MSEDKSSQYVTLVSNDGYEFKILRSAACIAGTIKKALDPMCTFLFCALRLHMNCQLIAPIAGFRENTQNRVDLPTIKYERPSLSARHTHNHHDIWKLTHNSGVVLEKVCEYLYYNQKHAESKDVSDMDIPPELCLELLIAADYLDGEHVNRVSKSCANHQ
jgi:transcription elongation factor B subunit 1